MGKKSLRKDFYMEIKKSFNRFVSILLIVALGVAFFSGVRAAEPDMRLSADQFYDESNLMDIRVLSGLGMTEADVEEIADVKGVSEVMPAYSADVLCGTAEKQLILKMMSKPEEINKISITEGRLPEKSGECLADTAFIKESGYGLGDKITVHSGSEEEIEDTLNQTEYTIVGIGTTSYYLSLERGTSKIGSGVVSGFAVILPEDFSLSAYTEVYLTVEGAAALTCYTDEYDNYIDTVVERLEDISAGRCEIRYAEVIREAKEKISDGEQEISDAEWELQEAWQEIEDARAELEEGKQKLSDAKKELEDGELEISDAKKEIADKLKELEDGKSEVFDGWQEAENGRQDLLDGWWELQNARESIEEAKKSLDEGKKQIAAGEAEFEAGKKELANREKQFAQLKELAELLGGVENLPPEQQEAYYQLEAGIKQGREQLGKAESGLLEARASIAEGEAAVREAESQLAEGFEKLSEGEEELAQGELELLEGQSEVITGSEKLEEAQEELAKAEKELLDGKKELAEKEKELADANKELADGVREYEEAKLEADEKLLEAKEKIADAKEAVSDLKLPEWYVLDRQYIQTYVEYGQDAERIGAIGKVFPLIFFLVAALVSLTTMTRMVEEERTQIGTLKALGYGNFSIALKYLLYALAASLLGSVGGFLIGQKLLPVVIIQAYKILYNNLPAVTAPLHFYYSFTATVAAVACTTVSAFLACYKELAAMPARLMRPAAPKAGKRVFLEKLSFVWKHLNFTYKATLRNLIRYKKRFFMTVFGIGGCTALLLVGYGVKDSIMSIGTLQFGEIRIYNAAITLEEDAEIHEKQELENMLENDERVEQFLYAKESSVDVGFGEVEKSAYLVVPSDSEKFSEFIILRDRLSEAEYNLSSEGVIITEKLASLLDVKEGDSMYIKDGDTDELEVKVTAIVENYFMHYVYMTPEYYEQLFGEKIIYNEILTGNIQNDEDFENIFQSEYMEFKAVAGVTFISGTAERIENMLKSMDAVIYVLVISAGLLAFIVLYNLNNINMNERKRELATIKVLGFYDGEVSAYLYRENIFLTIIGALAGIVIGIVLHRFVILTAEIDMLMFARDIMPISYLYSMLFTFGFSIFVNIVMHFKLKKVDMIESLKSVE